MNRLLLLLEVVGMNVIVYANNLAIAIRRQFPSILRDWLQRALNITATKTKLVLFNRKRRKSAIEHISLGDTFILFADSAKYTGLIPNVPEYSPMLYVVPTWFHTKISYVFTLPLSYRMRHKKSIMIRLKFLVSRCLKYVCIFSVWKGQQGVGLSGILTMCWNHISSKSDNNIATKSWGTLNGDKKETKM